MSKLHRGLLVLLVLAALGAAGAARVGAAEPTLGATIEGIVYADEDRQVAVLNRSTLPALFAFEPTSGWVVEPAELVLQPDEEGAVTITEVGTVDGAALRVRVQALASPAPGEHRAELLLTAHLWTERPADYFLLIAGAVLVTLGVTVVAGHRLRVHGIRR